MIAATAPIIAPQKTTTPRVGWMVPRCESVPITIDAASAPETKKIATRIITITPSTRAERHGVEQPEQLALEWAAPRGRCRCAAG